MPGTTYVQERYETSVEDDVRDAERPARAMVGSSHNSISAPERSSGTGEPAGSSGTIAPAFVREPGNSAENALIDRLRAGDEASFSDLVGALHGSLIRLARTLVRDQSAAEEVVQETWLAVVKGLQSFERRSSLRTWIYRILLNRGRTRGARDRRLVTFSTIGDSDDVRSSLADRFTSYGGWKAAGLA